MPVFRINKNTNYTVMSNYHLRDKELSYKAKGLLSFMLSLPETWDYSISGLVAVSKESEKAIRNILNELKDKGYLIVDKVRKSNGQYEYEYQIYEQPDIPKGNVVKRSVEKDRQISIKKKDKEDKVNPLLEELVKRDFINSYDLDIPYYNDLLNNMLSEYSYYDLIKVCGYVIDKWKQNKGYDETGQPILNKYGYFKSALENNLEKITTVIDLGY